MNAKKFYERLEELNEEIELEQERLFDMKGEMYSLNAISDGDRVQTSLAQDKIGDIIASIDLQSRKVNELLERYADKSTLGEYIIMSCVENEKESYILKLKYLSKKKMTAIAKIMDISRKHAYTILEKAEKSFSKEIKKHNM